MKKLYLPLFLIAACIASCTSPKVNNTPDEAFATDTISYKQATKVAEVELKADYPVSGNKILTNAIQEFVSEELGGSYTGDLNTGSTLLNYYGNLLYEDLENDAKEFDMEDMLTLTYSQDIKKIFETERYITYLSEAYVYMGGAHGMSTKQGSTFRKSDGRRFSYEMLIDTETSEFKKLIKKGLTEYFSDSDYAITSDDELAAMLITESDVNNLPLPEYAPYLTNEGVTFIYQQYEIAPYAAGMPQFTIPFSDIIPFMTTTAQNYFK